MDIPSVLSNAAGKFGARRLLIIAIFAFISFLLLCFLLLSSSVRDVSIHLDTNVSAVRNKTLGFGTVYVLTEDTTTWRVQGLRQAAKLTGLTLTIPIQPRRPDNEVYEHLDGAEPTRALNEIRAVLNYISLLETFLSSGDETALFFEDDVDFSIAVKDQMESISQAIFNHTSGADSQGSIEDARNQASLTEYPYARDEWDILWLGHWGLEYTMRTEEILYEDHHALPWDHLASDYNNFYELQMHHKDKPQQLLRYISPIASFAFALTRPAAERLIQRLRDNHSEQFDVTMLSFCKGFELTCMAPAPGLMYHHKVAGQKSIDLAGTKNDGKHDLQWWRNQHKYTYNVEWSARCNAAGVGEKLGDRWQCMPGKYDKNL